MRLGPPAPGGIRLFSFIDYDFSIVNFLSCSGLLFNLFSLNSSGEPVYGLYIYDCKAFKLSYDIVYFISDFFLFDFLRLAYFSIFYPLFNFSYSLSDPELV